MSDLKQFSDEEQSKREGHVQEIKKQLNEKTGDDFLFNRFAKLMEILHKAYAHRGFSIGGVDVSEYVCYWEEQKENCFKLLWIREPFTEMEINGKGNAFSHCDFPLIDGNYVETRRYEEGARTKVRNLFCQYWNIDPKLNEMQYCPPSGLVRAKQESGPSLEPT